MALETHFTHTGSSVAASQDELTALCRIEITFPITSDEQALKIRRDLSEVLNQIEKKRFNFSIIEA